MEEVVRIAPLLTELGLSGMNARPAATSLVSLRLPNRPEGGE
jgi:hypothetical protein